jgi:hypothetical protein
MSYLKLLRDSKARRRESIHRGEVQQDAPDPRYEETGALAAKLVSNADHQRLKEAGYKPKISFGKRVIWERPDTGFYVSQEIALHLLDTKNIRNKSGANARR